MADHHEGEHKHGTMDISSQEKMFDAFMRFSTRSAIVIIVLLVLLALVNG